MSQYEMAALEGARRAIDAEVSAARREGLRVALDILGDVWQDRSAHYSRLVKREDGPRAQDERLARKYGLDEALSELRARLVAEMKK